jgi:hypothetical protein
LYDRLLDELFETEQAAFVDDVSALTRRITTTLTYPVLGIGSGGSLIAAEILCRGIERVQGGLARTATPLEAVVSPPLLRNKDVWIFSAFGSNPDFRAAVDAALEHEAARITVVTNADGNLDLPKRAIDVPQLTVARLPLYGRKDGFLATHSLMRTAIALERALAKAAGIVDVSLVAYRAACAETLSSTLRAALSELANRHILISLVDPSHLPAAHLLETNLWEAGIGVVQTSDFRNFAHGRHVLPGRSPADVAVLGLAAPATRPLWRDIDSALPDRIGRLGITFEDDPVGRLTALRTMMAATSAFGQARKVDPAKPGVAEFGRALYSRPTLAEICIDAPDPAISRKHAGGLHLNLEATGAALRDVERHLASTSLKGIVLDYDGTVVATERRLAPPIERVVRNLIAALERGLRIGIASGRGGSVRSELRKVIPSAWWSQVLIGFYNGAILASLDDNLDPAAAEGDLALVEITKWLKTSFGDDEGDLRISTRGRLISLSNHRGLAVLQVRERILQAMATGMIPERKVLCSGHSVDVLAEGAGKGRVVHAIATEVAAGGLDEVLRIGDQGAWPGNDFELLASLSGLSVDTVSGDSRGCWNLLPPAVRGPEGLCRYLEALRGEGGDIRIDSEWLRSARGDQ